MRCLICGGAGFLGSHLAKELFKQGHMVSVIDDLSGGDKENLPKEIPLFVHDLRQPGRASWVISDVNPDVIYFLAANAAENLAQFSPVDISTRNYNTFLNTIVPAINHKVKKIIVTSSIAVYGAEQTPFKETDLPVPEDIYGVSKLAMEQSLKILSQVHGFEYVITRPHNVYGPYQSMRDPFRNVVTIWMNAVLKEEPYYIYGDGEQRRCFTYIDDVTHALVACLDDSVNGMTLNVGSDKDYSLNELSNVVQEVTLSEHKPKHLPDRPQEVKIAIADHTLAKKHLGYKDTVSLKDGIELTWRWAKMKGYQPPARKSFEIMSNKIPANWL